MRTVTYKSVLDGVMKRRGVQPGAAQAETVAALVEFIADRTLTAWEYYVWPEAFVVEECFFRPVWTARIWPVGSEVYHAGRYWRATVAASAADSPAGGVMLSEDGTPMLDEAGAEMLLEGVSGVWIEMTDYRKEVPYVQTGRAEIGAVIGAWETDPLMDAEAARVDWMLTSEGVCLTPDYEGVSVWLKYRRKAPQLAWDDEWTAGSYPAGAVVYHAPEVYLAEEACVATDVPGASAKWAKQPMPYILARAVKEGAATDAQGAAGQEDKELAEEDNFYELLDEQVWQITKLQGQAGEPIVRRN